MTYDELMEMLDADLDAVYAVEIAGLDNVHGGQTWFYKGGLMRGFVLETDTIVSARRIG